MYGGGIGYFTGTGERGNGDVSRTTEAWEYLACSRTSEGVGKLGVGESDRDYTGKQGLGQTAKSCQFHAKEFTVLKMGHHLRF